MQSQLNSKNINFEILDNIRGFAALYVVINHCRGFLLIGGDELSKTEPIQSWSLSTKLYYSILQFTSLGKEVVILFFVLSGFSIAHSLKYKYDTKRYFLKRIVRMYLPLIVTLSWASFVTNYISFIRLEDNVFKTFHHIAYNLLFIPTGVLINQFWSISHEALFYLFAPVINKIKQMNTIYLLLYASTFLYVLGFFVDPFDNIVFKFIFNYSLFFIAGVYLYFNLERIVNFSFFENKWIVIFSLFLISICVIILHFVMGEFNRYNPILGGLAGIIIIPFFIRNKINYRLLRYLGNISFTLYLSHFASMYLFADLGIRFNLIPRASSHLWWPWLLGVLFCVIISIPLYYIAEKPSKLIIEKLRIKSS